MKFLGRAGAAAIAACLCAAAAQAQTPQERLAPAPAAASKPRPVAPGFAAEAAATARPLEAHEREARRLLKEAAASSRFQVDAARLALARSTEADVRSLATTLQGEHAHAGNELLRMLHRRGLAAPMLENAQRKALTHLARLKGARFDREYLARAEAEAQHELTQCEQAAALVEDDALAQWIARTVPDLRAQVEHAGHLLARAAAVRAEPRAGARRPLPRSPVHHRGA
jgi:predicted outer membrane protein